MPSRSLSQRHVSPSLLRSFHRWVVAILLLSALVFIAEVVQLARREAWARHLALRKEVLRAVLREHGVQSESLQIQDVEWLDRYLSNLQKVVQHSNHSSLTEEDRDKRLAAVNDVSIPLRKVNGIHQPCIYLLPEDEIAKLELPPPTPSPIERLHYYGVDDDALDIEEAAGIVEGQKGRTAKMNLFAGKQTWAERAESFLVKEDMEVHCGFGGGSKTGFTVSSQDERFMGSCQVVVATCTFGGGDDLWQPIGMTNASLAKTCYVAFWDNMTVAAMAEEGILMDMETKMVGLWRIIVVSDLPFLDQRRNGKIPKVKTCSVRRNWGVKNGMSERERVQLTVLLQIDSLR